MNDGFQGYPNKQNVSKWGGDSFVNNINFITGVGISGTLSVGNIIVDPKGLGTNGILFPLAQNATINASLGNTLVFALNSTNVFGFSQLYNVNAVPFSFASSVAASPDITLQREDIGVLSFKARNGVQTNPHTIRLYNFNSNVSNSNSGSWLEFSLAGNNFTGNFITTVASGTGWLYPLILGTNRNPIIYMSGSVVGINNLNPITALDVTGNITCSGINSNFISSLGNLNLISNNTSTGIILTGNKVNFLSDINVYSGNNSNVFGYMRWSGSRFEIGNFTSGINQQDLAINAGSNIHIISQSGITGAIFSGTQTQFNGTVLMGAFSFNSSPGSTVLVEMPIVSGSGISTSGIEQSYSFNAGGTSVVKIYTESDNVSGIQNTSFQINQALVLKPSGLNAATQVLGTQPFYVYNGTGTTTWTMPTLLSSTGRTYFIKNRGNSILLTGGISTDRFFSTQSVASVTVNSGEAYILINDSAFWNLM